jgi:hypothetical protein
MVKEMQTLRVKAHRLAELIVGARPARMTFKSEQQFLALLALQPQPVLVRSERSGVNRR